MYRYEQHCPVARAAEMITDPWTVLIVRELLCGNERRADIAKGLPKMSTSLLGARLRALEVRGLVTHADGDRGERRYRLTAAGGSCGLSSSNSAAGASGGWIARVSVISTPNCSCTTSSARSTGHACRRSHSPSRSTSPTRWRRGGGG